MHWLCSGLCGLNAGVTRRGCVGLDWSWSKVGEAEEEVGGAACVAALDLAEFVCAGLAIVEGDFVRGACVLGEHQA